MHHIILGYKKDYQIDHINHDKTDNRKKNLRYTTGSQNCMNTRAKGYNWNKKDKKWMVRIMVNNKSYYLGLFHKEQDAMNARKKAEEKYFGEYANKSKYAHMNV
jgi:hypothetical protein